MTSITRNTTYFRPQVRGHYHSCLHYGNGPVAIDLSGMKDGDWIYGLISYWDGSARVWANAGGCRSRSTRS